jgi:glycine C-acetyltransferase
VLVFCANNYLGLSSHPKVLEAAHRALDSHGHGLSSVRFICGTQDLHVALEKRIAEFVGAEDGDPLRRLFRRERRRVRAAASASGLR